MNTILSRYNLNEKVGLDGQYFTLFVEEPMFKEGDIVSIQEVNIYLSEEAKPAYDPETGLYDFAYENCVIVTEEPYKMFLSPFQLYKGAIVKLKSK
jgi:hypothetical protein